MDARLVEIFKITDTESVKIKELWVPLQAEPQLILKAHGGTHLVETNKVVFGVRHCHPLGQVGEPR